MDCEGFQEALLAAPSAADPGAAGAGHARGCPSCAEFLALNQAIADALGSGALPAAPRRVRGALFAELERLHPRPASWDWRALLTPPRLAWAAGLAAAALLAVRVAAPPAGPADGFSAHKAYVAYQDGPAVTAG
ncbi:MAG: hypothetical protein HY928_05810 [Elusimicrobia bacterium]|nr:hypothetical protein [Elusimicrobiota bacterium]